MVKAFEILTTSSNQIVNGVLFFFLSQINFEISQNAPRKFQRISLSPFKEILNKLGLFDILFFKVLFIYF